MTKKELIEAIVELEWPMFHEVNGDTRADCQENRPVFVNMRTAQFSEWSEEALEAYRQDLLAAKAEGRNLLRDKYIHMMASTEPEHYEIFSRELPPASEEKLRLAEEIWQILLKQTVELRRQYPAVGKMGRPLRSSEEVGGYASVETYEKGELMTYSEKTLAALLRHIRAMEAAGSSYAVRVQENGLVTMGYASLAEAEADAERRGL